MEKLAALMDKLESRLAALAVYADDIEICMVLIQSCRELVRDAMEELENGTNH